MRPSVTLCAPRRGYGDRKAPRRRTRAWRSQTQSITSTHWHHSRWSSTTNSVPDTVESDDEVPPDVHNAKLQWGSCLTRRRQGRILRSLCWWVTFRSSMVRVKCQIIVESQKRPITKPSPIRVLRWLAFATQVCFIFLLSSPSQGRHLLRRPAVAVTPPIFAVPRSLPRWFAFPVFAAPRNGSLTSGGLPYALSRPSFGGCRRVCERPPRFPAPSVPSGGVSSALGEGHTEWHAVPRHGNGHRHYNDQRPQRAGQGPCPCLCRHCGRGRDTGSCRELDASRTDWGWTLSRLGAARRWTNVINFVRETTRAESIKRFLFGGSAAAHHVVEGTPRMEVMPRRAWWRRPEKVYAATAGRPGDAAITCAAPRTQCVPFAGRQIRNQCASRPRYAYSCHWGNGWVGRGRNLRARGRRLRFPTPPCTSAVIRRRRVGRWAPMIKDCETDAS